METMQDVTAAGVQSQADMDRHLDKAYKSAMRNVSATERGVELGMVRAIKGKQMIARARKIAGMIAAAAEEAALLHADQTAACIANGCDTGSLSSVGGISIMGGGDR